MDPLDEMMESASSSRSRVDWRISGSLAAPLSTSGSRGSVGLSSREARLVDLAAWRS